MLLLALCYIGVGLLFIGLAVPLIRERVPPNPRYGYRVPRTLNDPTLWYPVNADAGRLPCCAGIATIIAAIGIVALLPDLRPETYVIVMSVVLVAGALLSALLGYVHLLQLLRERS